MTADTLQSQSNGFKAKKIGASLSKPRIDPRMWNNSCVILICREYYQRRQVNAH